MSNWFVKRGNGKEQGPVNSSSLKTMAQSGKLRPTDQVRQEDMNTWRAASSLKGLFSEAQLKSPINVQALGEKAEEINQRVWFLDLKFTRFVTPKLIGVLFAAYIVFILLGFVGFIAYGIFNKPIIEVVLVAFGMAVAIVFNLIVVRVLSEIALVIFRIEEHLSALRNKG
jgi:hypothetical protein